MSRSSTHCERRVKITCGACASVAPCAAWLRPRPRELADGRCRPPTDIMEGKVSKGIYLKEEKGVTLLYYGRHRTSCLSDPARCGPEGERRVFEPVSSSGAAAGGMWRPCRVRIPRQVTEGLRGG